MPLSRNYCAYKLKLTNSVFHEVITDIEAKKHSFNLIKNDYVRSQTIINTLATNQKIYKSKEIKTIDSLPWLAETQKNCFLHLYHQGFISELAISGLYDCNNIADAVEFDNKIFSVLRFDKNKVPVFKTYGYLNRRIMDKNSQQTLICSALVRIKIPLSVTKKSDLKGTMKIVSIDNSDVTRKTIKRLKKNKNLENTRFKPKKFTNFQSLNHGNIANKLKTEMENEIKNLEIANHNNQDAKKQYIIYDQKKQNNPNINQNWIINIIINFNPIVLLYKMVTGIIAGFSWIYHEITGRNAYSANICSNALFKTFESCYDHISEIKAHDLTSS